MTPLGYAATVPHNIKLALLQYLVKSHDRLSRYHSNPIKTRGHVIFASLLEGLTQHTALPRNGASALKDGRVNEPIIVVRDPQYWIG